MVQKKKFNFNFHKLFSIFGLSLITVTLFSINTAFATSGVDTIAGNIVGSVRELPGLVTGIGYMIGLVLAVIGLLKMKDHVENPNNTKLHIPVIYLIIGGAMFALPTIYQAMAELINGGEAVTDFGVESDTTTFVGAILGEIAGSLPVQSLGQVMGNIIDSVSDLPGLVTGISYLLGLVAGIAGLLKIKEHVENPQTHIKEGLIRLVVGGMLFALPTIYSASFNSINGGGGFFDGLGQAYIGATNAGRHFAGDGGAVAEGVGNVVSGTVGALGGSEGLAGAAGNIAQGTTAATIGTQGCFAPSGQTLGNVICNVFWSTSPFSAFLTAIAYLFGIFVGAWAIFKLQDHVSDPQRTPVWDPISKFLVAGGFFALPTVVIVAFNTVAAIIQNHSNNGFNNAGGGGEGLDVMITNLMTNTFGPMVTLIGWFGVMAGFLLIFIAISRLMKSAQDGPRGPGGVGTIMTFVTGGALLAFSPMVSSLTATVLGTTTQTATFGVLGGDVTAGMDPVAIGRAHAVISAIVMFVMLLGMISIMRGIFIMRGVSEGTSQASSMAGITHLIGGALAVNLGPMINAVQATLGISSNLGLTFGDAAGATGTPSVLGAVTGALGL